MTILAQKSYFKIRTGRIKKIEKISKALDSHETI